ncbi:MAG TPA: hypothetical protein VFZ53_06445 [Polyangiaceae bacterium]
MLVVVLGCGGKLERDDVSATQEGTTESCTTVTTSSGFWTQPLDRQGGVFHVTFDAIPSAARSDAVVGLALGPADWYTDLAAIVRFNPNGFIDARNGGAYAASSPIPYAANVWRRFFLSVDLINRRYSASVDGQELARDFAFRTEHADALALDGLVSKVESGGALSVCNVQIQTLLACDSVTPTQGFVNTSLPVSSSAFTAHFIAVPRAANMDGVMGISAGPAAAFNDLAAAVRFGPGGTIDVRNGSTYSVLEPIPYIANAFYSFLMVADVQAHTYSVLAGHTGARATNLAFRPQQASVASLGNFAKIVESSSAGTLAVCPLDGGGAQGAAWIHDAERYAYRRYSLAVSNDRLLLSDDHRTLVLDAAGAVTREIPYGGATSVTDAAGNLYLFGEFTGSYDGGTGPVVPTPGGGRVYVSKYDANLNPIYTRVNGTTPEVRLSSPSADAQGQVAFVLRDHATSASTAVVLYPSGETRYSTDYPVTAVALDASGDAVIGSGAPGTITVSKLDSFGGSLWTRSFPTDGASLTGVLVDSLGNAVFWGEINGSMDFDGYQFIARSSENGSLGYIGVLAADGTPRFVRATSVNSITSAVAGPSGSVIVAGMRVNPDRWELNHFNASGHLTKLVAGDDLLPALFLGGSGHAAVDTTGSVYWQFFPRYGDVGFNYLAKLLPF